ncbi:MAG: hypothetical protein IJB00_08170 [Akkermansia sp.]|nr:hypothetical protein [Akkermansia sp.]
MKKSLFFALFAALPVMAQEAAPEQCPAQKPCCKAMPCAPAKPCCGKHGERPDFRKMMLEKFDANKDGQLDDAEKAAAKAAFEAKRAEMKAAFEKKMLEKFDADKDGQLNDAEKAAAKAEFEKMRAERGPKCGKRGHHGPKRPCCGGPRGGRHMDPARCAVMHDLVKEKYDADKNGQLDEAEKAAFKADVDKKRGEMKAAFENKMLEKFDANKDGQLDDAEKAAAKAAFEAKRSERRGKCGERGPKGPRCCPPCGPKPEKKCDAPAEQPAA